MTVNIPRDLTRIRLCPCAPLGVGLTSDAEYVDIGLITCESPETMVKNINGVLSDGFYVTGFHILSEPEENEKKTTAMSLVSSADYLVSLKDGYSLDGIVSKESFQDLFNNFYGKQDIIIRKKTKKNDMDVNIRPMITMVSFDEMSYNKGLRDCLADISKPIYNEQYHFIESDSKAEVYENDIKVYMQLDTGSASNLKPELVMEAFCNENGIFFNPYAWQIHRLEIYTRDEMSGKLISLDRLDK